MSANDQQIFDQLVQQTHAALGEERFASAWYQGERLAQEQTDFAALLGVMLFERPFYHKEARNRKKVQIG